MDLVLQVLLCLDYDGTLTPIVSDPAKALLPSGTRDVLRSLLHNPRITTAFVSGRAADKVQGFLGLGDGTEDGAYFITAGSHGFDIRGRTSDGKSVCCTVADAYLPVLEAARDFLTTRLGSVPGAAVEDNRFSITAHWRNVPQERVREVEEAVDAFIASPANQLKVSPETAGAAGTAAEADGFAESSAGGAALEKRPGKCVWELRPDMDWNKGRAVEWILRTVLPTWASPGASGAKVAVIVIGDDATDEDMFRAASDVERRIGGLDVIALPIIVAEPIVEPATSLASPTSGRHSGQPHLPRRAAIGRVTHALAFLRDPADVADFLAHV